MKIITLKMPWCFFVTKEWKTIETRTHKNFMKLRGQRIGIHAGLSWDKDWEIFAGDYMTDKQIKLTKRMPRVGGYIIATAFVKYSKILICKDSKQALIDCCNVLRYGLILEDIKLLKYPVPFVGRLGVQNYDGVLK